MTMLEVRDGLWPVGFSGEQLASSDTWKKLPAGISWDAISPDDAKSYLRWVEMKLFRVDIQPDPEGRIQLPEGGYFYHVIHQTVCYHRHDADCESGFKGVPTDAGSTETDLLPCPVCRPPLLWDPAPADPDDPMQLCDPTLVVDVEPVRHDLYREATPLGVVNRVTGKRLTVPAGLLLEGAKRNDPQIRAVYARPTAPTRRAPEKAAP